MDSRVCGMALGLAGFGFVFGPWQAAIASGAGEDDLRLKTGILASSISAYKQAAAHARKLKSSAKTKLNKAAPPVPGKAAPEPSKEAAS